MQSPRRAPSPPTSRRAVLRAMLGAAAAATSVAVTGCDFVGGTHGDPPPASPVLDGFLAETAALAALYEATLSAHANLVPTLGPVRDAHRAHLQSLVKATGRPLPTAPAAPGNIPPGQAQAVAALAAAERTGADKAVEACVANVARLAPLLGSIAAARASHLEVLS